MKTGIFIDLDGTLINSKKEISTFDQKIIKQIQNIHNVYLITGKSLVNALPYYQKLGLKTKLITSMGQLISWPTNSKFEDIFNPTNNNSLDIVIKELNEEIEISNLLLETAREKYYVWNKKNSNMLNLICHDFNKIELITNIEIPDIIGTYVETEKISEGILTKVARDLNQKYENWFTFSVWHTDGNKPIIHIKPYHIGKSQAMQEIIELDKLEKTIAFGNGWSDFNMLQKATIGVAMLNANEKIRQKANRVTKFDNNNSGVGKALKEILKL